MACFRPRRNRRSPEGVLRIFNALVVDGIVVFSDLESCRSHEVVQVLREIAPDCDEDLGDVLMVEENKQANAGVR